MKKITQLMMTVLLLMSFTNLNAQIVEGTVTGAPNSIPLYVDIQNGTIIDTIFTDSTGYFMQTYNTSFTQGTVTLTYEDCNLSVNSLVAYFSPTNTTANFGMIDFCPNVIPTVCSASFTLSQNVVFAPNSNTVISTGNVMIINTSTGQNLTYTWDFGDGSSTYTGVNFTHTYASAGPWTLCLTVDDGNGCTSTFCDSLMVDSSGVLTGKTNGGFTIQMGSGEDDTNGPNNINNLEDNVEFALFPNPAINTLNISLNSKISDNASISIYNTIGSIVEYQTTEITTGEKTTILNIENLKTGLYIIQLKTNEGIISKKFFKK